MTNSVRAAEIKTTAIISWNDPIDDYFGNDLMLDSNNNLIVVGHVALETFIYDITTIKYDTSGNILWLQKYRGPNHEGINMGESVDVDEQDNIYITGKSFISNDDNNRYDVVTIKYDENGQEEWLTRYNGPDSQDDYGAQVKVVGDGSIIVVAGSYNKNHDSDLVIIKYDNTGNMLWSTRYDNGEDEAPADFKQNIAIDDGGNLYILEFRHLLKYDPLGSLIWEIESEQASSIHADNLGNYYLTSPRGTQLIDSNGNSLWSVSEGGIYGVVNNNGDLFSTTVIYSSDNSERSIKTCRINYDGTLLWTASYSNGLGRDSPRDIALDSEDNVYVAGESSSRKGLANIISSDYLTIRYDSNGNEVWIKTEDHGSANELVIDAFTNIYVTGTRQNIKYSQEDEVVDDPDPFPATPGMVIAMIMVFMGVSIILGKKNKKTESQ